MSLPDGQPTSQRRSGGAAGAVTLAEDVDGADGAEGSAQSRSPGRMPDFFVVGHEKCGTTALFKMLRRHPQIFMPDHKEPRFFSSDLRAAAPEDKENKSSTHPRTLDEYLALFAPAAPGQLVGEASPQYIRSPGAAKRIAQARPDARIIAILREPASFLCSVHSQYVHSGVEPERDLRKALALEEQRRLSGRVPGSSASVSWVMYSQHVRYVEQLQRFHAEFPADRVLVLIYDDYRRDLVGTVRTVMRFLGTDADVPIEPLVTKGGEMKAVRFMPLHRVTRVLRRARDHPQNAGRLARTVSALTPRSAQVAWKHLVYAVPPAPDERLVGELRRRFKPEVQELSDYLDRDLVSLWGYDRV